MNHTTPAEPFHFLGVTPNTESPVIIPIRAFLELAWFIGPMGTGKSVALTQLAVRLISLGYSVIFLDLKGGSMEIHESLRIVCAQLGIPMKRFTITQENPSHALNPFAMKFWSMLSPRQRAQFLLAALGVEHDLSSFGQSFFTTANAALLAWVFERRDPMRSLIECSEHLAQVYSIRPKDIPEDLLRHGGHIAGALNRLRELEALHITGDSTMPASVFSNRIDFSHPFQRQQVHYYHLPMSRGSQLASELGRFLCRGYIAAAETLTQRRQVFCFIDEFASLASHALNNFLSQSRSLNIGVILANQSPSQIQDPSVLGNLVDGTRYRQWFGLGLDGQPWFETRSGRRLEHLMSQTVTEGGDATTTSTTLHETFVPHISVNDIKRVTADPRLSLYELVRGIEGLPSEGFAATVQTQYNMTLAEYQRRQSAPWPDDEGTFRQRPPQEIELDTPPPRPSNDELSHGDF